jgi:hypothetical protein
MIEFLCNGKPTLLSPQTEVNKMGHQNEQDMWKYAEQSMKWFGWGSPVGLGLFFMSLAACVLLLHMAGIWH